MVTRRASKRSKRTSRQVRNPSDTGHRWFRFPQVSDSTNPEFHEADWESEVEHEVAAAEKTQRQTVQLLEEARNSPRLADYKYRMAVMTWATSVACAARAGALLRLIPADGRDVSTSLRERLEAVHRRDLDLSDVVNTLSISEYRSE